MRIHAHSLESLHILHPKLCSAVEFEDLRGAWNTNQIAVLRCRVILRTRYQINSSDLLRGGIYLGVLIKTHAEMKVPSGLDVVVGPVAVEFLRCYAFLAVVE
jgi:hypothetical protein